MHDYFVVILSIHRLIDINTYRLGLSQSFLQIIVLRLKCVALSSQLGNLLFELLLLGL